MAKNNEQRVMFTLNCNGRLLVVDKPLVMGIINVTPDSFFEGSRHPTTDGLLEQAGDMLRHGADILDIGGQSTRPGSERIGVQEELDRVIPAIQAIHRHFPTAFLSIDTYQAAVARQSVAAGAALVNDISAGSLDDQMIPTIASLQVPYVLMHMKGEPLTMQETPHYADVTREVVDFFINKLSQLEKAGVRDIIIDPGFGFGKTIAHNFELLRNLSVFTALDRPLLLGVSRKSTVYKTLGVAIGEALNGTTVLNTIGLLHGANILRVHDVREAREAITLISACIGNAPLSYPSLK